MGRRGMLTTFTTRWRRRSSNSEALRLAMPAVQTASWRIKTAYLKTGLKETRLFRAARGRAESFSTALAQKARPSSGSCRRRIQRRSLRTTRRWATTWRRGWDRWTLRICLMRGRRINRLENEICFVDGGGLHRSARTSNVHGLGGDVSVLQAGAGVEDYDVFFGLQKTGGD